MNINEWSPNRSDSNLDEWTKDEPPFVYSTSHEGLPSEVSNFTCSFLSERMQDFSILAQNQKQIPDWLSQEFASVLEPKLLASFLKLTSSEWQERSEKFRLLPEQLLLQFCDGNAYSIDRWWHVDLLFKSAYFKEIVSNQTRVKFLCSSTDFDKVIQLLYSETLPQRGMLDGIKCSLELAGQWQLKDIILAYQDFLLNYLEEKIEQFKKNQLNSHFYPVQTFLRLLEIADQYEYDKLRTSCIEKLIAHSGCFESLTHFNQYMPILTQYNIRLEELSFYFSAAPALTLLHQHDLLSQIQKISLQSVQACDLKYIANMLQLQYLAIHFHPVQSIEAQEFINLIYSTSLKHLHLSQCRHFSAQWFEAISQLDNLETLTLNECQGTLEQGIEHLSKLKHLHRVEVNSCPSFKDEGLGSLSKITNLNTLILTSCDQLTSQSIACLEGCQFLKNLKLKKLFFLDERVFQSLMKIRSLKKITFILCPQIEQRGVMRYLEQVEGQQIWLINASK